MRICLCDTYNHAIKVLTHTGNGGDGMIEGWYPIGVAIDHENTSLWQEGRQN